MPFRHHDNGASMVATISLTLCLTERKDFQPPDGDVGFPLGFSGLTNYVLWLTCRLSFGREGYYLPVRALIPSAKILRPHQLLLINTHFAYSMAEALWKNEQ